MKRGLLSLVAVLAACAPSDPVAPAGPDAEAWRGQIGVQLAALEYRFQGAAGQLQAHNRAQGYGVALTAGGARVSGPEQAWSVTLGTVGPDAPPQLDGDRVVYRRGDVVEWFTNGSEGLRQGWTVQAGGDEVVIDVAVTGAVPRVARDGRSATLGVGTTRLHYRDLRAWDAAQVPLVASMRSSASGLQIRVDTTAAAWPVTVDPVLTTPFWTVAGTAQDQLLGAAVQGVGDVNADGFEDVLVGLPGSGAGGAVALYLGAAGGPSTTAAWSAISSTGCDFGGRLGRLGDVDGDGFGDFVVGDDCAGAGGRVHVWYGQANVGAMSSVASWIFSGTSGSSTGVSVAGAGDVDGDGFADLLVGASNYGTGGGALLFLGSATGFGSNPAVTLVGTQPQASTGSSVASAGDVNGDGLGDVLVGSPNYEAPLTGLLAGRVQLFLGTGAAVPLSTTADWTAYGEAPGDRLGVAVAGLGDVDGDGYADIAAGAPAADVGNLASVGRVFVWRTPGGSPVLTPETYDGLLALDSWGDELAGVGDVNGDGYADMGVGAPGGGRVGVYLGGPTGLEAQPSFEFQDADDSGAGPIAAAGDVDGDGIGDVIVGAAFAFAGDEGSATIYRGARTGPSPTVGDAITGSALGINLGVDVAGVGDVNADGYDDVLVGAHNWSNGEAGEGAAFLYLGTATGIDPTSPSWSAESDVVLANFGERLSGAGDVNGDGFADWLVGAPDWSSATVGGAGRIYLYLGSANVAGTTAAWEFSPTGPNTRLGSDVGGGGDVNGDGYADLVAGARLYSGGESNEGAVYVWFGGATGPASAPDWSAESNLAGAQLGRSVAFVGDVNGDGFGDIAAGAPEYDDGVLADEGAAFVWLGSLTGPAATPDWSFGAWQSFGLGSFGDSVAGAGDVNGDGFDDLVVGAPQSTSTNTNDGRALLFEGSSGAQPLGSTPAWSVYGGQSFAFAGTSVAGTGDVNGDGYGDVAVGAPGTGGTGRVAVYLGDPLGLGTSAVFSRTGSQGGQELGASVASAGDTNGDGVDDLIAGAPFWDVTTSGAEGKASIFLGNAADGRGPDPRPLAVRLIDPSGVTVAPWGRANSPSTATATAPQARGPWGRMDVALELEAKPLGVPFNATDTALSPWTDVGTAGAALNAQINALSANTAGHWRARLRFRPSQAQHQLWGPWVLGGLPGQGQGVHARTGCLVDTDSDGVCDEDDDDDDDDGSPDAADCDDTDPAIYPGATELCDGTDSDCDASIVDEFDDFDGDANPDCNDLDDDGDGDPDIDDCAPFDAGAFHGNTEVCDGADNDCDGVVPQDEADADADGARPCAGDCDDANAEVHAGHSEVLDCLDNDCDGAIPANETADTDLDGAPACTDCDDTNPLARPGNPELCDGADSDCDGAFDTDGLLTGEQDDDGDGFSECEGDCDDDQADQHPGAPETGTAAEDLNCDGVWGQGEDQDGDGSSITDAVPDCDDGDPTRFPGNPEVCDGVDNDCDGLALSETADADGDGYFACEDCNEADPLIPSTDNQDPEVCDGWNSDCDPEGFPDPDTDDFDVDGDGVAACEGDCDDNDASRSPQAPEICGNGLDEDCDDAVDEDEDADEDGVTTCLGDCADADPTVFPGAAEVCDGLDQDCDGLVDEDFDNDGDGVADCGGAAPDCDDADPTVFPGAPEDCADGLDNDCDPATFPFLDLDGDGLAPCPGGDCDDTSDAVSPAHAEVCDGIDNDCDGEVDEDLDVDNDGLVWCTGDCSEGNPGVRAGLPEICDDGIDQDCDQRIDDGCDPDGEVPRDIVFPAGCVCDAVAPASAPGVLALLLLLVAAVPRRRAR